MKKIEKEMISQLMHLLHEYYQTIQVEQAMEEDFGEVWLEFRDRMW
jgi:hypothetical protein